MQDSDRLLDRNLLNCRPLQLSLEIVIGDDVDSGKLCPGGAAEKTMTTRKLGSNVVAMTILNLGHISMTKHRSTLQTTHGEDLPEGE